MLVLASLAAVTEAEKTSPLRCGHFGASGLSERHLSCGDFAGVLSTWDLERLATPVWQAQAHGGIINAMDAMGGARRGYGAPEIVTGGRDGRVCVWDPRQHDAPVAAFEPPEGLEAVPDCWTVAFGDSHCDGDRSVLAGYDNGDVKLFDLRNGQVRWERNLKNGVCAAEFDRRDIAMNKCAVATLEGKFHVFDMRTHNKERGGYAGVEEKFPTGATLWGCTHLPQNRDLWMVGGGDGTVSLYKYAYPDQRRATDADGKEYGVTGEVRCLTYRQLSTQPINCWDWSADKEGLAVCGSFDQSVRVVICSRLSRQ